MNVQKLNIILEALRCGSITKAAEEMGYTQSGLTYAINSLESELGFPVVIRDSGGIRLSREGQELLPFMEEMVECEKRLSDKAKLILNRRGKTLNVGAYPSISANVLPRRVTNIIRTRQKRRNWRASALSSFAIAPLFLHSAALNLIQLRRFWSFGVLTAIGHGRARKIEGRILVVF